MSAQDWQLADLDTTQLDLVREAERTLDADYLLAYRPTPDGAAGGVPSIRRLRLRPAPLDESQVECLQGLEQRLGVVTVAYRRGA